MADTDTPETTATADAAKGHGGARLLLVDDEPSVLAALRRLFRAHGHVTVLANSGAEALRALLEEDFDLVISDMRMPEMDGAALLESVRALYPGMVRILLTGYADIHSTIAAINRGEIHRYIAKPWDDHDLLLVVSETLQKRALQIENAKLMALTAQQNQQLQELNQNLEARVASRTAELEQVNSLLEQSYAEVEAQFTMAVTVFSGLLEMRQNRIAGHSRRVADLARRMAKNLGLMLHAQREVELAALLHDIGKIGFNDAMLGRPVSSYGGDELVRYHQHPLDGEAALMPLDKLHGVALIIRQHHERIDGRGFPEGLYGAAISVGAKIVAVASDYDGLTSGTLAERVFTKDLALKAIVEGINSRYEERVVKALFAALAEVDAEALADTEVDVADLRPGMVLSKDLQTPQGAILLPKGFRFNTDVIRKVTDLAARSGKPLPLMVLIKSIPAVDKDGKPNRLLVGARA